MKPEHAVSERSGADRKDGHQAVEYRTRITFSEVDYGKILFHGKIHDIAEKAIEEWYLAAGINLRELIRELHIGIPIVESRCVYVSPIRYLDEVEVRVGVADLSPKGYRMLYNALVLPEERLAAAGHLRHRFVDTKSFRGTVAPAPLVERFRGLRSPTELVDGDVRYRW